MKQRSLLFASATCFIVAAILAFCVMPVFALQGEPPASSTILDAILSVFLQFASLAGVGALLAALINIGKAVGLVKDDTAGRWLGGLSLLAIVVLVYFKLFQPAIAAEWLDAQAAILAQILLLVLGYVVQLGGGVGAHSLFSTLRLPLIGKSYSKS